MTTPVTKLTPIRKRITCLRCGWVWLSRLKRPLRCSQCGSFYWDVKPGEQPAKWETTPVAGED